MDRNEKQNSYKNMVSSRGNNREINQLKQRFRILSVIIILLLAAVIALGVMVGKMYLGEKKEPETGAEKIINSENEELTEEKTETEAPESETEITEQETLETEALQTEALETEDKTEKKPDIVDKLKTDCSDKLDKYIGEMHYKLYIAGKSAGESEFYSEEAGEGYAAVFSDQLAALFILGKVYQCLNDSYSNNIGIEDNNGGEDNNGDLRKLCLKLIQRTLNVESDDPARELLKRIGVCQLTENKENPDNYNEEDKKNEGIQSVNEMLRNAISGANSTLTGYGVSPGSNIFLKDMVEFMKLFESDTIWRNDNKDQNDRLIPTRDKLKECFTTPYDGLEDSKLLSKLKEELGDSYTIYWIEDTSKPTHVVILLEKKSEEGVNDDTECFIFGLYAQAIDDGWVDGVVKAICNDLDRNGDN